MHTRELGLELGVGRASWYVCYRLLKCVGKRAPDQHQAEGGVGDLAHVHEGFRLLVPHDGPGLLVGWQLESSGRIPGRFLCRRIRIC